MAYSIEERQQELEREIQEMRERISRCKAELELLGQLDGKQLNLPVGYTVVEVYLTDEEDEYGSSLQGWTVIPKMIGVTEICRSNEAWFILSPFRVWPNEVPQPKREAVYFTLEEAIYHFLGDEATPEEIDGEAYNLAVLDHRADEESRDHIGGK